MLVPLYGPVLTTVHDHWEEHSHDYTDFVGTVIPLLFNTLSRFVIVFLPRSNHLLLSWLQSASAVILEPKKRKSVTTSTFPPSICYEVMKPDWLVVCELPDFQAGFIFLLLFFLFYYLF